ncbi:hypothetical protein [Nitrosopumilus sp.]|uniref:hypothetical protein n=1 Tax=Nitrosopumilus sp. TaxID=2024843 RepID=UPI00292DC41D|nr:hypothetical protein [Nitrosopumilus sp.]
MLCILPCHGLTLDSFLYVELVDDLIVMKKHDPKLTKIEKAKSKRINEITTESYSNDAPKISVENGYNPLDDVF